MHYDNDTYDAYDENDEPVCVCPDYEGAQHPVFCKACNMWTDDAELLKAEPAEWFKQPEIPALPRITTPVYQLEISKETAA